MAHLCNMYFKSTMRNNPASGHYQGYYRLVESYRNEDDRICHRTLLNVGFLPGVTPEQLNMIQSILNDRVKNQLSLFEHSDLVVEQMTNDLWNQFVYTNIKLPHIPIRKYTSH